MSLSIVKKSLELFDEDLDVSKKSKKEVDILKKGIEKKKSKFHKIKPKSVKEEYQQKESKDNTEESLYLLQQISSCCKPEPKSVKLILDHHKGKLAKDICKVDDKKGEERTVFTDRDFDNFEEEYDFFS